MGLAMLAVMVGFQVTAEAKPSGTVRVVANPSNGGTVVGGGTYPFGTRISIHATPNSQWVFTQWNDNVTTATRTVTVPKGTVVTYTAMFQPVPRGTIICSNSPPQGGTITGCGSYPVGQNITLSAQPSQGWTFSQWQDGSSNATVNFTVPAGTYAVTAYFVTNTYGTIAVAAEPANGGTVSGSGTYPVGQSVTVSAVPAANFSFTQWQDGNTSSSRPVTVVLGTTLMTATFTTNAPVLGTINALANPSQGGTVTGTGSYPVGQSVTMTATPNTGWRFTQWQDGNTSASRTVTVQQGTFNFTANFAQYGTITLASEPPSGGTTTGSGTYPVNQSVMITAVASTNWSFTRWQDGNVTNPRTVTVAAGTVLYTATFTTNPPPMGTIACGANPAQGGTVAGCGTYTVGQNVTILAQPAANWRFTAWQDGYTNASRSVPVPPAGTTTTWTASFAQYGTIQVSAEPPNGGTVSGAGSYPVGQVVTLTAAPAANWRFTQWQDGLTNTVRQITVGPGSLLMTGTFMTNTPPVPGSAMLNWTPSALSPDAHTYYLKWGIASKIYTNTLVTNATAVAISGLDTNVTYFFAVQALSTNGNKSPFSCEVAWRYGSSNFCGL